MCPEPLVPLDSPGSRTPGALRPADGAGDGAVPVPDDAAALAARWPGLDLRPVRLNGRRRDPADARSYTVLDARGVRVVGEIRGGADGQFAAVAPGGQSCGVFATVAAALAAFAPEESRRPSARRSDGA
jgi:hypothetical protein